MFKAKTTTATIEFKPALDLKNHQLKKSKSQINKYNFINFKLFKIYFLESRRTKIDCKDAKQMNWIDRLFLCNIKVEGIYIG